ncbi:MAG TPA: hypothetical protein VLV86_05660 [Vicinamibacterales bacterium]|nr:hypothetical protein [Vicinamibacterales bacterium]
MRKWIACVLALSALATTAYAQDHDHAKMMREMAAATSWQWTQDGVVWAMYNDQGSDRGGSEFVAPNWWMLMGMRKTPHGMLTLEGMISLEPATVGSEGYRELFQAGEAFHGNPIVDRQHPHDFFMRLQASWDMPLTSATSVSVTGAAVGSPALGPIPYMHRASAFDNPMAPLTHHLFDSTHVSFGVATAAVEHGPWRVEGSVFNGREPDDRRWNFDFGPMDSVSGRVWFTPSPRWMLQVSTGHLVSPEQLEPGNTERTTASASWTRTNGSNVESVTAGYGRNDRRIDSRDGVFVEGAKHIGGNTTYGRVENLKLDHAIADVRVTTFEIGGVHDILTGHGFEGGVGAGVTVYKTPALLDPSYGPHPMSFQLFVRVRRAEHMVNME